MEAIGISGKIARAFIDSKLTPLVVIAAVLLGVFAILVTPREEEPQIVVPMIDVMVTYPGATSLEVEQRVTRPMERLLWEIEGVEYVYSIARPGMNLTIVRFYVNENMEDSLIKLYNKLMSNYDRIPAGVSQPMIKPKSIDDVPVLAFTLWSDQYSGYDLRRVAEEIRMELKQDKDVSEIAVKGGQKRQVKVRLDPAKLDAYHVTPMTLAGALKQSNAEVPAGAFQSGNKEFVVESGGFLMNAEDVGDVVVGVYADKPVYIRDVATIEDGAEEPNNYVLHGDGLGAEHAGHAAGAGEMKERKTSSEIYEAVTVSVAKKRGTNASVLTERMIERIESLKGWKIPSGVNVEITRNYGETAQEKSNELLKHMLIATVSVIVLIAFTLGWRESIVVAIAVPVTLALTLMVNYAYGYTLNRVTLFALIFSIGILVDDAIVVVENIHRHFQMKEASMLTAILAVDEVGNPTILATFTVIAALMPMAFVSGLMGPYMKPIPMGASAAMLFSLLVAFIVSPWLGYKVLKNVKHSDEGDIEKNPLGALYEKILRPLVENRKKRFMALVIVIAMLIGSVALVPLKAVKVKMLPFDNKSEFQIIIDMPEASTLEDTTALARDIAEYVRHEPEVMDFQIYSGTSAPYNFNGLVRHYFLRSGSNVADVQVNLTPKHDRKAASHEIAKRIRPGVMEIAARYGGNVKIAEIPPGPPVLSTLVAEVYGPDLKRQREIAQQIKQVFEDTEGVVDVDWYVEDDQDKYFFEVNKEKAALNGISPSTIAQTLRIALNGMSAGMVHLENEKEPVDIMLRMPVAERSDVESLKEIKVFSPQGRLIPLSELVTVKTEQVDKTIYHKNLKRVTYVVGEVAGTEESPVYAILNMKEKIRKLELPEGYELKQYSTVQPEPEDKYSMKWDGEWHISYEVFRDLGIAFALVLILIYILVVGWFRSFITPLVIMFPIPLTLVGILPGHAVMGAFFTATSMIGFIALAGIVVRNSILLVDFIEMEMETRRRLENAIIQAGVVRLRPIILTAAAVVVGSFVMLFDPIFQGLAISMMYGAVASTLLTLLAVPLVYYEFVLHKDKTQNKEQAR